MASGVRSKLHVVLLVEDNVHLRELYAFVLREADLIVHEVGSVLEALAFTARLCPDLVLLDRHLPDGDGWDVARALKANSQTRHVPIIAFTMHRERSDVEGALVAGCDVFLEKGCTPDVMVRHVRGMLALPLDGTEEEAVMVTARERHRA